MLEKLEYWNNFIMEARAHQILGMISAVECSKRAGKASMQIKEILDKAIEESLEDQVTTEW